MENPFYTFKKGKSTPDKQDYLEQLPDIMSVIIKRD